MPPVEPLPTLLEALFVSDLIKVGIPSHENSVVCSETDPRTMMSTSISVENID